MSFLPFSIVQSLHSVDSSPTIPHFHILSLAAVAEKARELQFFCKDMVLRHTQGLVLLLHLLFSSGNFVKTQKYSTCYRISASTTASQASSPQKSAPNINEEVQNSTLQEGMLLPEPKPKPLIAKTQNDDPSNPAYNTIPIEQNPTTPMTTPSTMNPTSGLSWCISSQSASEASLQVALDYACGYGGADCSQIQPGGSCFDPDTVRAHASYAFNNYYLKNPVPASCDFGGTAIVTNVDSSTSTCQYPSTSTSNSVLNTTNPTGSTVFEFVPPHSSASDPMLRTLPLCFSILAIILSPN